MNDYRVPVTKRERAAIAGLLDEWDELERARAELSALREARQALIEEAVQKGADLQRAVDEVAHNMVVAECEKLRALVRELNEAKDEVHLWNIWKKARAAIGSPLPDAHRFGCPHPLGPCTCDPPARGEG